MCYLNMWVQLTSVLITINIQNTIMWTCDFDVTEFINFVAESGHKIEIKMRYKLYIIIQTISLLRHLHNIVYFAKWLVQPRQIRLCFTHHLAFVVWIISPCVCFVFVFTEKKIQRDSGYTLLVLYFTRFVLSVFWFFLFNFPLDFAVDDGRLDYFNVEEYVALLLIVLNKNDGSNIKLHAVCLLK